MEEKSIKVDLCFNTKKSRVLFRLVNRGKVEWKSTSVFSTEKSCVLYRPVNRGKVEWKLTSVLNNNNNYWLCSITWKKIIFRVNRKSWLCLKNRLMFVVHFVWFTLFALHFFSSTENFPRRKIDLWFEHEKINVWTYTLSEQEKLNVSTYISWNL